MSPIGQIIRTQHGSYNGLWPGLCQAITWTSDDQAQRLQVLSVGTGSNKAGKLKKILISDAPLWFAIRRVDQRASCLLFPTYCPACRTSLIATRFWVVMICPIIKCLTVLEFSFILFDLCLFITIFNFILNYVPIVTFWILTYHKIWILLIIFCFIWSYWIIYFLTCLEVFWSVVS